MTEPLPGPELIDKSAWALAESASRRCDRKHPGNDLTADDFIADAREDVRALAAAGLQPAQSTANYLDQLGRRQLDEVIVALGPLYNTDHHSYSAGKLAQLAAADLTRNDDEPAARNVGVDVATLGAFARILIAIAADRDLAVWLHAEQAHKLNEMADFAGEQANARRESDRVRNIAAREAADLRDEVATSRRQTEDARELAEMRAEDRTALDLKLEDVTAERDRLQAVIDVALALHTESKLYTECGHDHTDDDSDDLLYIDEVGTVCEDGYVVTIRRVCCCTANGDQSEECANHHDGPCWPCPTRVALQAVQPRDETSNEEVAGG